MRLRDRTTIVTGASSGIGRAIAFTPEGANVVLADVREGSRVLDDDRTTLAVIEEEGGSAVFQRTDVTDEAELLDGTLTDFGGWPDDIAPAAVLLASDGGRYIHGHNLVGDGGSLVK